eukprot:gene3083-3548_t
MDSANFEEITAAANNSEKEIASPDDSGVQTRPQFGNRFLTDVSHVYSHNAWDNVEWNEDQEEQALLKIKENSVDLIPQDRKDEYEEKADSFWHEFYLQHQNRFFKDRHWLFTEFPELAPDVSTQKQCSNNGTINEGCKQKNIHCSQENSSYPGQNSHTRIFEVGCGVGNTVFPILQTNRDPGLHVYCCDFAESAINLVKNHADYNENRCTAFVCDISSDNPTFPCPEASIDVIVLIFVLSAVNPSKMQHVANTLSKLLKPGGRILFRDYGRYDMAQLRFKKGKCLGDNFYVRGDGTRVYFFTQEELATMFKAAGLQEEQNHIDRRLQVNRAKDENLAPVLRKARFEEAISLYQRALDAAQTQEDNVSATKNLATANWRLGNFLCSRNDASTDIKQCFKNAICNFSKSCNSAKTTKCQTIEWVVNLVQLWSDCVQDALESLKHLPFREKMASYEDYAFMLDHDGLRAEFCLLVGTMYFHESIRQLAEGDFKNGLRYLHECYRPIEEATKAAPLQTDFASDIEVLREDVKLNTFSAESRQAIATGDKLYEKYELEQGDNPSAVTMIWEVVDWYKKAVVLTRECDMETEGTAVSRIGRVYFKVLNMKSKARENFQKAIQLGLSLHPRVMTAEAWFKESTETLAAFQKEQVEQEDQKWNEERQKYIDELKDVLKELKEKAAMSDVEFLKLLYKKHPPIKKGHVLPKDLPDVTDGYPKFSDGLKKILRNAIIHYHPDRCDTKQHGEKRKVLNEEITKLLTKKYEVLK